MPISDEVLQREKNRFIAVKGDAKFGQAIAALNALGGQQWWHLVVRMDDGSWRVARFSELAESLSSTAHAAEVCLRDLQQLRMVSSIERISLDTKAAQTLSRKSAAQILVVTDNGLPIGILVEGVRRGVAAGENTGGLTMPGPSLDQLGGAYVKLKDYGSILLGSSKK
jgi:hypothetical protein